METAIVDIMIQATQHAGLTLRNTLKNGINISDKTSQQDLVTSADVESQKIIEKLLKDGMLQVGIKEEEIGFIGEEGLVKKGKYIFAFDPIDGTTNYASGIPQYAVAIACFINENLTHGVVYLPEENSLYYGTKGMGAYRKKNDVIDKIKINPIEFRNCVFSSYIHSDEGLMQTELHVCSQLLSQTRGFRIFGSGIYDMTRLLENKLHAVVIGKGSIWDIASQNLLLEESEGILLDWKGDHITYHLDDPTHNYAIVACHPTISQSIIKITSAV